MIVYLKEGFIAIREEDGRYVCSAVGKSVECAINSDGGILDGRRLVAVVGAQFVDDGKNHHPVLGVGF